MNDFFEEDLQERTSKLAYEYWERRGRPLGSPEIDWFAAEHSLESLRGYPRKTFSLGSIRPEPDEGPYR